MRYMYTEEVHEPHFFLVAQQIASLFWNIAAIVISRLLEELNKL